MMCNSGDAARWAAKVVSRLHVGVQSVQIPVAVPQVNPCCSSGIQGVQKRGDLFQQHDIWQRNEDRGGHALLCVGYAWGFRFGSVCSKEALVAVLNFQGPRGNGQRVWGLPGSGLAGASVSRGVQSAVSKSCANGLSRGLVEVVSCILGQCLWTLSVVQRLQKSWKETAQVSTVKILCVCVCVGGEVPLMGVWCNSDKF